MIHVITKAKEQPPSEEFLFFSYEGAGIRFDIYIQVFNQLIFTKIGMQVWLWYDESEVPVRIGRNIELNTLKHVKQGLTLEQSISLQMLPLINAMWRDLYYELPPRYRPRSIPKFLWMIG